jgi:hypothetical protein
MAGHLSKDLIQTCKGAKHRYPSSCFLPCPQRSTGRRGRGRGACKTPGAVDVEADQDHHYQRIHLPCPSGETLEGNRKKGRWEVPRMRGIQDTPCRQLRGQQWRSPGVPALHFAAEQGAAAVPCGDGRLGQVGRETDEVAGVRALATRWRI